MAQSRRLTPTRRNTDSAADMPLRLAEPPKRTAEPAVECVRNARKSPGFKSPRARHDFCPSPYPFTGRHNCLGTNPRSPEKSSHLQTVSNAGEWDSRTSLPTHKSPVPRVQFLMPGLRGSMIYPASSKYHRLRSMSGQPINKALREETRAATGVSSRLAVFVYPSRLEKCTMALSDLELGPCYVAERDSKPFGNGTLESVEVYDPKQRVRPRPCT